MSDLAVILADAKRLMRLRRTRDFLAAGGRFHLVRNPSNDGYDYADDGDLELPPAAAAELGAFCDTSATDIEASLRARGFDPDEAVTAVRAVLEDA